MYSYSISFAKESIAELRWSRMATLYMEITWEPFPMHDCILSIRG